MSVRGVVLLAVLGQVVAVFGGCTVTSTPSGDGGTSGSSSGGVTVTCHQDSTVTVTCMNATGWSCTGHDSPEQSQALVCSTGVPDGNKTDYCCTPYDH
jgi:hypothetical protein